jgi:hypothetical protein
MTDTSVKFYHSDMQGAPALNGLAGSMVGLLDSILNTGFGIRTITAATITSGVCTVTFSSSTAQDIDSVVLIAGLTPASGTLNGEQKVTASSSTSVSFATTATGSVSLSSASVRTAPLNWSIAQTGTNKRAYKPTAVEASGCLLRVDDTNTNYALVTGYESMSDIDTGLGPFPTSAVALGADGSLGGGWWRWYKDTSGTSTTISWFAIGDSRGFYLCPAVYNASGANYRMRNIYAFGDMIPQRSGDAWCAMLQGIGTNPNSGYESMAGSNWAADTFLAGPRTYSGIGGAVALKRSVPGFQGSAVSGDPTWYTQYPNPADNGLILANLQLFNGTNSTGAAQLRGRAPGLLHVLQNVGISFQSNDRVTGSGDFTGKNLMAVRVAGSMSSPVAEPTQPGAVFFDISGPWR